MSVIDKCPECDTGNIEAKVPVYLDDVEYDTETFQIKSYRLSSLHAVTERQTIRTFITSELGDSMCDLSVGCDNCGWSG